MIHGSPTDSYSSQGEVDRLSNLPDDILLAILERLDICDAARTSAVSKQLRHIPTMLNRLVIKASSFEPNKEGRSKVTLDELTQANATMAQATKSILERRQQATATRYALHLLSLHLYLGDDDSIRSIAQTVAATMETQAVGSVEFAISTKKDHAHGRQLTSLFEACPNAFAGLTRLKLENLSLKEEDLPSILSVCKRLEFLRLYNCDMGILSSLQVEHARLGELDMDHCRFERVHLKWLPNLTVLTFEGWISQDDPLCFGFVPLLASVTLTNIAFSWHKMLQLSGFLGNARISTMRLNFKSERVWIRPECPKLLLPVFCRLRLVSLIDISDECDLNWTTFILQGAPSLEELHIMVRDHLCEMLRDEELRRQYEYSHKKGVDWEEEAPPPFGFNFMHHKLAVLKIFGFRPEDKFVSYVRGVIEAAVNLQDVFLYNKVVCDKCKHRVPKASRSPWPKKQRFSLRNRLTSGTNSFAVIHFPNSSSY